MPSLQQGGLIQTCPLRLDIIDQLALVKVAVVSNSGMERKGFVYTGGEGTWKPVITCWVHLELMCIFPTI